MRTRGWGTRRGAAVVAIVLAIAVAGPELASPAGAANPRSASRSALQSRPAARAALHAKRKRKVHGKRLRPISAAKKKALLTRYIKTHPAVVAAHARRPGATLAKKLKLAAYLRTHPRKKLKGAAARKRVRKPTAAAAAKKKKLAAEKRKKKKAAASSSWHREAVLLVGTLVGIGALFLIGSSVFGGPRSRARARARRRHRTLVTR
jgi:hypothetical protein